MEADYAQPHQLPLSNDTGPVDENGTMIKSWLRIESELPEFDTEGTSLPFNEDHVHHLDCSGLYFDHPKFGVMPIQSVTLKYRISLYKHEIVINDPYPPHYVLKTNKGDDERYVHVGEDQITLKGKP